MANPPEDPAEWAQINLLQVFPNLQSRNLSVSGSTSLDCVQHQLPRLPSMGSNVFGLIVITTGGNDLISAMVSTARNPGIRITAGTTRTIGITTTWRIPTNAATTPSAGCSGSKCCVELAELAFAASSHDACHRRVSNFL